MEALLTQLPFVPFRWRGRRPSSTLPPWPRIELFTFRGRQYSQSELAGNASIRAQSVIVPCSAALVTTPLRLPVTRASFVSTPTPGLRPVMEVELAALIRPVVTVEPQTNRQADEVLARPDKKQYRVANRWAKKKCHFIPSGQGKEPISIGDINLRWAAGW